MAKAPEIRCVFYPDYLGGGCALVIAIPMAVLGFVCIPLLLTHGLAFCVVLMIGVGGCVMSYVSVRLLFTRVVVDPGGITKTPRAFGLTVKWTDIVTWMVEPADYDMGATMQATFKLRDGRSPKIFCTEVQRPGFDAFLSAIRMFIGNREVDRFGIRIGKVEATNEEGDQ